MTSDIVRAWKDESYRQALSAEQRCALPANPAGPLEITGADLAAVSGGYPSVVPTFAEATHGFHYEEFLHSFALVCDEAKFSLTALNNAHVTSPITIICINGDIR